MKIKVIIVDDEIHARGFLRKFCERYFSELIYVMDECNSVESAVRSIKKYQPDLVFLDIQMPEENGFELLKYFERINFEIIFIEVIFCTKFLCDFSSFRDTFGNFIIFIFLFCCC